MKKEEVRELAQQFVAALEEEKEIRAKLLDLKMTGDQETVEKNLAKHDAMIDNIAQLREKKMLPILETLGAFIAEKTGTARSPQQRLRDAIKSGQDRAQSGQLRDGMPGKQQPKAEAKPAKKSGKAKTKLKTKDKAPKLKKRT